jgi:hypothetical protein
MAYVVLLQGLITNLKTYKFKFRVGPFVFNNRNFPSGNN